MRIILLITATTLLGACTIAPEPVRQYGPTVTYGCSDGSQISAEYSNDGQALNLHANGSTHTLIRTVAAEGSKYDNDRFTLWSRDDANVQLQTKGVPVARDCHDTSKGGSADAANGGDK